jgi:SAM-dependent methyltransferase
MHKKYKLIKNKDVLKFINLFNIKFDKKLTNNYNYARVVSLSSLRLLLKKINLNFFNKVAVMSGDHHEPELKLINYNNVDLLNYDDNSNLFDLDKDWKYSKNSIKKYNFNSYDFILCNHVLEHIFSPMQGLKNIYDLLKKGGYAWISCPTINCIHGEPFFYSSGYHPRYLNRLAKNNNFKVIYVGYWGNKKYLIHAVNGRWLLYNELLPGFRSRYDFLYPQLSLIDGTKNDLSGKFICDTWALLKKN